VVKALLFCSLDVQVKWGVPEISTVHHFIRPEENRVECTARIAVSLYHRNFAFIRM